MSDPIVLFESHRKGASFRFCDPCDTICVSHPEDVGPALDRIERAVHSGLHAAGFFSYEAASGLDPVLKTHVPGDFPLMWFGLFRHRENIPAETPNGRNYDLGAWRPSISRSAYDAALNRIRDLIIAGDTYQVNYSFRLRANFSGNSLGFYRDLCRAQRTDYAAYLDIGRFQILSASPELFFALKNGTLTTRPMKGTAPRGRWWKEDKARAKQLQKSQKDRAENVMIVDLLRNDLGRVSKAGSVKVPALWHVEHYETLLQMTSTVTSRMRHDLRLRELVTALFPCGSVTGAPKVRTMEIIKEVEQAPRGIYTGSIGYLSPGGDMAFNVAIRTVRIDRKTGIAEFGVGSGITCDSSSDGEYEECLTKARLLADQQPAFDLFETLRYDGKNGFFLLNRHIGRIESSARYFGFAFDRSSVLSALKNAVSNLGKSPHRVRLVLSRNGCVQVETAPLKKTSQNRALSACISPLPVDSRDPLLFHKTTRREPYTSRLDMYPMCEEIILINERGEATECSIGNLVAKLDGLYVTPPISCGLLGGTFRAKLMSRGKLTKRVLKVNDLKRAEALYMINSVRKWTRLKLVD
ncbi:MAG: aminodeoxychorismate synthase component I [Gemmatimonadota bacterium]|nr:aminodeoxychorismate synthase component I [Gemmatimonadota bacterium]MDE2955253.1 aminodeoxychorismate synthase component I [Gemmatimonadota bacterium]